MVGAGVGVAADPEAEGVGASVEPGCVGASVGVAEEPHATAAMDISMIRRETMDFGLRVTANKIGFLHAFIVGFEQGVLVLKT